MGFPLSIALPADEAQRLKFLREHEMLDLSDDSDFDDIVQLAAVLCEVPISLVAYMDADRQVYKARVGLRSTSASRSVSFCTHAMLQDELFIVPDARNDERFRENPHVLGAPFVCFYAGAPIVAPDGVMLGTLCVVDHQPRELNATQREGLRLLSRMVSMHIRRRVESSMKLAA